MKAVKLLAHQHFLTVSSVANNSTARELGLEKGDKLVRINNSTVSDIIDYHILTCEKALKLEIIKQSGERVIVDIRKDEYESLGLFFEEDIPGGIRHCCNKCVFCFVDQLPSGLRDTLYVRDDDYRHSFLYGNYVSLTNLDQADWERVKRMRLSPLYVSVHSTDPDLRAALFGNPRARRIMEQLKELAEAGITVHTQVVVCPGINDGEKLDQTLRDLASLWPAVSSVSVVPVGVTKYQKYENSLFYPVDRALARDLITRVEGIQLECLRNLGYRLVFAADELYLKAGEQIPAGEYYEDFPQLENGVGMARLFMDELAMLLEEVPSRVKPRKTLIITGVLVADIISEAAKQLTESVAGVEAAVLPVENRFFGPSVTVTGLLTGQDIAAAVEEHFNSRKDAESAVDASDTSDTDKTIVVLPDVVFKADADVFLDGFSLKDIKAQIGRQLIVVENSARGFVQGTLGVEVL